MMKTLATLFMAGSLVALPALAAQSTVKTNPAGSHSMTMTKSGTGLSRTITKSQTNTEGHQNRTVTRTLGPTSHTHHVSSHSHKKTRY